ncbi:carbon monoxide dehydrogenase [Rhodobacterales bacterium HKCCSP123]|nr:carbon monoxide dehydrogenase [Rhodobacterales bacterium HKCCSP123]
MLDVSHNPWLVLASVAVALMAGFTGLSLTRGASRHPSQKRKLVVAMSAIALGGGIWSMHFVAMLGLQLPFPFYYDALITLISALIAILLAGLALLVLHFRPRSRRSILAAGAILGIGIVLMHFVGMAGMQVCRPVNGVADYLLSTVAAIALASLAIGVAYDQRSHRNILAGTLCFGFAVAAVHYLAIWQTGFVLLAGSGPSAAGPALSNQVLAMGVTVAAFLICSAFLLTGVTFFEPPRAEAAPDPEARPEAPERPAPTAPAPAPPSRPRDEPVAAAGVPYEKDGQTQFVPRSEIAAIRAEGHYTVIYAGGRRLFCPWSITEADTRLSGAGFVRAHRSYLVNPVHVSSFTRNKDTGTLLFEGVDDRMKVPVSRSRIGAVREALGL